MPTDKEASIDGKKMHGKLFFHPTGFQDEGLDQKISAAFS